MFNDELWTGRDGMSYFDEEFDFNDDWDNEDFNDEFDDYDDYGSDDWDFDDYDDDSAFYDYPEDF